MSTGTRLGALECAGIQALLPTLLDRREGAPAPVVAHVEHCLACQAELARYRRLLRLLRSLAPEGVTYDTSLGDLVSSWSAAAERHAIRSALTHRRTAYVAGLTVGLGAASVLALRRARPVLTRAAR